MKEISPLKPFEFSPVEKDKGMTFLVVPSEYYGGVMVAVADGRKEAKARGNPYPKRGQIKKKIFNGIGDWIASVCRPSIGCASAAEDEAPHFLNSPTGAKGYCPYYKKRLQIKARMFMELLR